jgi:hypothetical protein
MGLNDELEKIRQAEAWLLKEPPGSQLYNAAKDHLFTVAMWGDTESVRKAATEAIARWADRCSHANLHVSLS